MGCHLSLVLHLGVVDMPYDSSKSGATTGDVATWLEGDYHVMRVFFELHDAEIAAALEESIKGSLETVLMGGPGGGANFGSATSAIEDLFRKFIDSKEMDRLGVPGVPTQASLMGVSKRFKLKRGPVRPSFQDTGLYEDNFTAWVEQT